MLDRRKQGKGELRRERERGRKSVWKTILEIGNEEETKIFAGVPFLQSFTTAFWGRPY